MPGEQLGYLAAEASGCDPESDGRIQVVRGSFGGLLP